MPDNELIELLSRTAGRAVSLSTLPLLLDHLAFLIEANSRTNLTAIRSTEEGLVLHLEDSLTATPELDAAPEGALVDLGSGSGYPGIPLATITGRLTTLVEARQKKAQFLKDAIARIGMEGFIEVETQRIETFTLAKKETYSVVTARALSELPVLLELASPLLKPGGWLIAYKGIPGEQEIQRGDKVASLVGMTPRSSRTLVLSDKTSKRTILVYEKTALPLLSLPRRDGTPQKKPLA